MKLRWFPRRKPKPKHVAMTKASGEAAFWDDGFRCGWADGDPAVEHRAQWVRRSEEANLASEGWKAGYTARRLALEQLANQVLVDIIKESVPGDPDEGLKERFDARWKKLMEIQDRGLY